MEDWIKEFVRIINDIAAHSKSEFDWIDIGAAESMDAYLLPLLGLKGKCLTVDASSENNPQFEYDWKQTTLLELGNLVSNREGYRFFFIDGTGSTLYPNQDTIGEMMLKRERKFSCSVRSTIKLSDVLQKKDIQPSHIKIDIEGGEVDVLKDIFKAAKKGRCEVPMTIEMEINVGERGPMKNCGHVINWMDKNSFRMIDMRKTYMYPRSDIAQVVDEDLQRKQVYHPSHQGCLHQFDGLFVHKSLIDKPTLSLDKLLKAIITLTCYRQFHLCYYLIENNCNINGEKKISISKAVKRIHELVTLLADSNTSSIFGYHPYFNWLKST